MGQMDRISQWGFYKHFLGWLLEHYLGPFFFRPISIASASKH